jgi:hypothetical protein
MAESLCEMTDLPAKECGCPRHRGTRTTARSEVVHPPPAHDGERPPKDAILIHKSGRAHWYGCSHLPDYDYLVPPTWGWNSDSSLWLSIGNHVVPATGGNTQLVATVRCLDCD